MPKYEIEFSETVKNSCGVVIEASDKQTALKILKAYEFDEADVTREPSNNYYDFEMCSVKEVDT